MISGNAGEKENQMKAVVFTDYVTCSYCKKAKAALASFAQWCADNGIAYVAADRSADASAYAAAKRQYSWGGGSYPQICLHGAKDKKILCFVARNMTLAKIVAKVLPYCDGCSDGVVPAKPADPVKPTKPAKPPRKKRWFSLLITSLTFSFFAGCVSTDVSWTQTVTEPKDGPKVTVTEVKGDRDAFFYPFKVSDVEYKAGELRMGSYQTSGGAAELVPLVDANGKLIGSVIGGAAKAAVAP